VPLNTDAPSYELVPFSDVDDDLVEATASWAADLTDTEYRDHAETLVKRLWPDEYENHDGWEAALKSWAEAESEREERQEQARLRARQRRRERKEQMGSGFEGAPITPFREDVYDAIDRIDTADVVRKHASDAWNTGRDSNDKIEFDPPGAPAKAGARVSSIRPTTRSATPGWAAAAPRSKPSRWETPASTTRTPQTR